MKERQSRRKKEKKKDRQKDKKKRRKKKKEKKEKFVFQVKQVEFTILALMTKRLRGKRSAC